VKIQSLHTFGGSKLYVTIESLGFAVVLMSEPIINYCNSVLSILTNYVDCGWWGGGWSARLEPHSKPSD